MKCLIIKISGIVQGVGFRPFIYNTAKKFALKGYILNASNGVVIEFEGLEKDIYQSIEYFKSNLPRGAKIDEFYAKEKEICNYEKFEIRESSNNTNQISVSPDLAICPNCQDEFNNSKSRFYRYPFISCASCGPRVTIIKNLPYDRFNTSMKNYGMCKECENEYTNPEDRRYHAQTISCNNCGPRLSNDNFDQISKLLAQGKIVALKGIGGYHIACDATNTEAIDLLRERKKRKYKPFAVMMELKKVYEHCFVSEFEKELLLSKEAPIVLLKQKDSSTISRNTNPNSRLLGVMLPYTGMHKLLLEENNVLIMTSGNESGGSIVISETEAEERLAKICDVIINHDREITIGCDDSVVRSFNEKEIIVRRSRGYVPVGIKLNREELNILACGGDLKNTFGFLTKGNAHLSQHIGDLSNNDTFNRYVHNIKMFKKLLHIDLQHVICDFHPGYQSLRYANSLDLPITKVQHHYAHILSVMGEHELYDEVIGIAFDGTGYGEDGNIWGGEFFTATRSNYSREYHFQYNCMPGGDCAVKEPWRMAISYLYNSFGYIPDIGFKNRINENSTNIILKQIDKGINAPYTSSMGRLFEGVASIIGVRDINYYEGQGAIELEEICDEGANCHYDYRIEESVIYTNEIIGQIVKDLQNSTNKRIISSKFHNTITQIVQDVCQKIYNKKGIKKVVLSGGVFQNIKLLSNVVSNLSQSGFQVFYNCKIPANDGGISFGQIIYGIQNI